MPTYGTGTCALDTECETLLFGYKCRDVEKSKEVTYNTWAYMQR